MHKRKGDSNTAKVKLRPRLIWRPQWNLLYLSLWAITHRLCAVNCISRREFWRYFAKWRERTVPLVESWGYNKPDPDLRVFGRIDERKIAGSICDQDMAVTRYSCFSSIRNEVHLDRCADRNRPAKFLRYCPLCMKQGLHVSYFQFLEIDRCPVHGVLLREECPNCGSTIPYTLPGEKGPFHCVCGHALWECGNGFNFVINEKRKSVFREAGARLVSTLDIQAVNVYSVFMKADGGRDCFDENNISNAYAKWCDSAEFIEDRIIQKRWRIPHNGCRSKRERVASIIESKREVRYNHDEGQRDDSIIKKAMYLYKSVRRHYWRRVLKEHKTAIRMLCRLRHFGKHDYATGGNIVVLRLRPTIDPLGIAFIAWRCYWEGVCVPAYFVEADRNRRTDRFEYRWMERRPGWGYLYQRFFQGPGSTGLHDALEERILAQRLHGVFEEIVARISAILRTRSTDGLNLGNIDERYVDTTYVRVIKDNCAELISFKRCNSWQESKFFTDCLRLRKPRKAIIAYEKVKASRGWEPRGVFRWATSRNGYEGTYLGRPGEGEKAFFETKDITS